MSFIKMSLQNECISTQIFKKEAMSITCITNTF